MRLIAVALLAALVAGCAWWQGMHQADRILPLVRPHHYLREWDLPYGTEDPWKQAATLPHSNDVNAVAFSPDGRWLATEPKLWSLPDWKEAATVGCYVGGAAFSPDGRWLATGSSDETVKVWLLAPPDSFHIRDVAIDWHAGAVTEDPTRSRR